MYRIKEEIKKEKSFLADGLRDAGIRVFDSDTGFLLTYSEDDIFGRLLGRGVLIRDCSNFAGLRKGYYRMAVKSHSENVDRIKK